MIILLLSFNIKAATQSTILLVGDSLSAAYGIPVEQGWGNLLKHRLVTENYRCALVNASISGDTTAQGMARLPSLLTEHSPKVVIIALGANDGLRGFLPRIIEQNLQTMITQSSDADVVLIGLRMPPNYGQRYTQAFSAVYHNLAKSNEEVTLVPEMLKDIGTVDALFQADQLHPTAEAQPLILKNIWPSLVNLLEKHCRHA